MDPETTTQDTPGVETKVSAKKKGGVKAPAKAKGKVAKKEKTGAWKKDPKKLAELKKAIPLGSLVKYTGARVEAMEGKSGIVVGYRDANGLAVDFGKLGRGTISVPKAEVLRKGPAKGKEAKEEKSA